MKTCIVEGCNEEHRALGYCTNHYYRLQRNGHTNRTTTAPDGRRGHKYYNLWHDRKQSKYLCDEWLNFWTFAEDIGEKPDGNFQLVRLDGSKPYSKDNFKWQEHLKRKKTETRKEWHARKWAARQANNPGLERKRTLKRRFGMTHEQHEEMIRQHDNKCAICGEGETSYCSVSGSRRRLAIDHCHNTGKIRGLLCYRCNTTIGKVKESREILNNMIKYLDIHSS